MISRKNKIIIIIAALAALLVVALSVQQIFILRKAHSTFENYYVFRGCAQLVSKTDNDGTCKIGSGQIIKIVKFQNRWYLDGDLPICWQNFCF